MFKALFIFIILYLFLFDVILLAFKYKFDELYFTQYFYVSELNHTVPAFNTNISFEKYMTYQALSRYVATPKCMQYLSLVWKYCLHLGFLNLCLKNEQNVDGIYSEVRNFEFKI